MCTANFALLWMCVTHSFEIIGKIQLQNSDVIWQWIFKNVSVVANLIKPPDWPSVVYLHEILAFNRGLAMHWETCHICPLLVMNIILKMQQLCYPFLVSLHLSLPLKSQNTHFAILMKKKVHESWPTFSDYFKKISFQILMSSGDKFSKTKVLLANPATSHWTGPLALFAWNPSPY